MSSMEKFVNDLGLKFGEKFTLDLPSHHGMSEVVCGKTYMFEETGLFYIATNKYGEKLKLQADCWIYWALLVGEEMSHLKVVRQ